MGNIMGRVAYASPRMFMNIYSMALCTWDLVGDNCNRCLVGAVLFILSYCDDRQGARIVYLSCY